MNYIKSICHRYIRFPLIIVIILSFIAMSQEHQLEVKLDQYISEDKDSVLLYCEIQNTGNDTVLVLSLPFFIEGKAEFSPRIHPWPGHYFTANILFYEEIDSTFSYTGDADIRPYFDSFPSFYEISPGETINMELIIPPDYFNQLKHRKFNMWVTICYTEKASFDKIIKPHIQLWENYENSVKSDGVYSIMLEPIEYKTKKEHQYNIVSKLIHQGMALRAHSPKVVFSF
jgi:hypothetical protein